jgi:hypothetical protein
MEMKLMNHPIRHRTSLCCNAVSLCTLMTSVLVLAFALPLAAYSAANQVVRFRPGLFNSSSRPLTARQLQILLEGLRQKTGLLELRFEADGFLQAGDRTHIAGGSATARALVLAAIDGRDCFKLENHYLSPMVGFAQIRSTEDFYDAAGVKHEGWHVEFDFHDFSQLRGGAPAIAAFDPVMHLLHELGHGVLKLSDTVSQTDPLGDCERHINKIRRELGLPERQSYYTQNTYVVMPGSTAHALRAELIFVQAEAGKSDGKKFSLFFNAERVALAALSNSQTGHRSETGVVMQ